MSFTGKLQATRKELLWLVTGTDKGRDCWYYVQVEKPKLQLFKSNLNNPKIELLDYGTVLFSGWGSQPPEYITQKVLADE